jgi:hypothetical protein
MQKRFGEESIWVYNILRGMDDTPGMSDSYLQSACESRMLTKFGTISQGENRHKIDVGFKERVATR